MSAPTDNERERYYDEVLAPKLREVAGLCRAQGMPIVAVVYFDGETSGVTRVAPDDGADHPPWQLVDYAWKARGNLDSLCMAIVREIRPENDHSIATRTFRLWEKDQS